MSTLRKSYAALGRFLLGEDSQLFRIFRREEGAMRAEYGLLLVLLAVICIGAISLLISGPQKDALKEAAGSLLPANKGGLPNLESGPQQPVGSYEGRPSGQIPGPEVTVD
jgi:Flp pilus assembly pilin Flp